MDKLERYHLEKLKDLARDYIEKPSKNLEFGITEIFNLSGQDLIEVLDYISEKYIKPYLKQEKILSEEREERLEEELREHLEEIEKELSNLISKD
jgi:hypothetical protein